MMQSRDGVQEEQETVLYPTFPMPTNIRQSSVVGLEEEEQTHLRSEIRDKSCLPLGKRQTKKALPWGSSTQDFLKLKLEQEN